MLLVSFSNKCYRHIFRFANNGISLQDGCFKLSQMCLKNARLVQLQIHLLPLGICIINLDERGLKKFLSKHSHFFEVRLDSLTLTFKLLLIYRDMLIYLVLL